MVPYQTSKKRHRLRCIQRIINITKKAGKVEGSIGSAQNQKIERAIKVYSQYPKDRVITAIDKKKGLTVEEKQIVLERLQIDSRNMQASTFILDNNSSESVLPMFKSKESHHKSKKVKKAIKYFKGKDISPQKIENLLEAEHFTTDEIQIVLSSL